MRVCPRLPQSPVHDCCREPEGAPCVGERVEKGVRRGVVAEPARAKDTGDRREQHESAHGRFQRQFVQHRYRVQLGAEHGVHVVVGHLAEQRRPARQRGQIDPVQWGKVGPESFEQRRHRGLVRRIGSNLDELGPARRQGWTPVRRVAGPLPGHRDDRRGTHLGELSDQVLARRCRSRRSPGGWCRSPAGSAIPADGRRSRRGTRRTPRR